MKKLELKNLKIKTLSLEGQASIKGGYPPCTGGDPGVTHVNTADCNAASRQCTIPDAPGGVC